MLKDISRVEADVVSHGEAVLNGRLSKSQQRLIQGWHKLNFSILTLIKTFTNFNYLTKNQNQMHSNKFRAPRSKVQMFGTQEEQNRLSCLALNDAPTAAAAGGHPKQRNKLGKSKSFRDTTGQKKASGGHQRSMSR